MAGVGSIDIMSPRYEYEYLRKRLRETLDDLPKYPESRRADYAQLATMYDVMAAAELGRLMTWESD